MKQNDPEMTKAKRVLVGQVALAFAIVAVIVWLWGWEAGITAVAVMAAAFVVSWLISVSPLVHANVSERLERRKVKRHRSEY